MKAEVQIFQHPMFGEIRTAGTPQEPLFCLTDVCKALELTNPTVVAGRLDNDERTKLDLGRQGETTFINESGLYSVVLRSDKPEAKQFRKWVTSEVLPAIRKTGGYIQAQEDDSPAEIMAKALKIADRTLQDQQQRIQILEGENEHLLKENKELAPKAEYTDEVLQSTSTYTFTQIAKDLGMRSVFVFQDFLKRKGIAYKQSGQWLPTAKYSERGYFATRTAKYFNGDGSIGTKMSTVVTEQGRQFLHTIHQAN